MYVHLSKHEPRYCNRASVIHPPWLRVIAHRDVHLRAKVLNNDFLNVAAALLQIANCEKRIHAIFCALTNADQDSRGEWDTLLASFLDRPHPMLDDVAPLEIALATGPGADAVINLLGRAAYSGGV